MTWLSRLCQRLMRKDPLRSATDGELRAMRGAVLVAKGELLGNVLHSDRANLTLTADEEREQVRLSAELLRLDRELHARGAAPWAAEDIEPLEEP